MKVSAPGKLFLAGEWAVLEVGNPGIVAAVNKRVHAELQPAESIIISIDDFGISNEKFTWDGFILKPEGEIDEDKMKFMVKSIAAALSFLQENGVEAKPFSMRTWGDQSQIVVEGKAKKLGFGSSAASVVAVIAGVLKFHDYQATKKQLYKLATIAHYYVQGKVGSAFDVAASTWGGVFVYKRFDALWLVQQMEAKKPLKAIVDAEWPGFSVEQLNVPEQFHLDICWTRDSASTSKMVKQFNTWASENEVSYKEQYDAIANLVREIIPAWKDEKFDTVLELLRKNGPLLKELGERSGVGIETPDLEKLSTLANKAGAAGKLSGAGGGDCGIAISFDSQVSEKVRAAWKEAGLFVVDAGIDKEGVRIA